MDITRSINRGDEINMWEVIPELQVTPGIIWVCENLVNGKYCHAPATWRLRYLGGTWKDNCDKLIPYVIDSNKNAGPFRWACDKHKAALEARIPKQSETESHADLIGKVFTLKSSNLKTIVSCIAGNSVKIIVNGIESEFILIQEFRASIKEG